MHSYEMKGGIVSNKVEKFLGRCGIEKGLSILVG